MIKSVRAVVFDFGNVMTLPVDPQAFHPLVELCNLDFERFTRAYRSNRTDFDRGTINGHGYWSRILSLGGVTPTAGIVETLIQGDIGCWTKINPVMVDWFRRLKRKGFATAVLSNMPADILKHILSVFPWLEEFDVQVYSCSVGSVKPEAEIYQHCLQALGLPPAEILFLDDAAENTAAAERLGFNTLTFETPEKAQTVLDRDYDLPELIFR